MAKLFIDAGHNYSGYDMGATSNGLREPDVDFRVASHLAELCRNAGHTVIESRPEITVNVGMNASDSINQRAKLANSENADYFVSVHCNAGGGKGTETSIYLAGGPAEKMAKKIQSSVCAALNMTNRGVKVRAELGVIRLTKMPSVLIEMGFVDNPLDAKKLATRYNEFAVAIFEAIQEFLGENADDPSKPEKWAAAAWKKAVDKGIFDADMPREAATRQQVAAALDKLGLL